MDMVLYALLKKEMQNFEAVSGYKIKEVKSLPPDYDDSTVYIINPNAEGDDFNYIADEDGFVTIYKNKSWYFEKTWKFVYGLLDINKGDGNGLYSTIYIEADLTKQDLDLYLMEDGREFTEDNEDAWIEKLYMINIYADKDTNILHIESNDTEGNFEIELPINSDKVRIAFDSDHLFVNGNYISGLGENNRFPAVLGRLGRSNYFTIGGEKRGQGFYNLIGYYNHQLTDAEKRVLTTNGRSDA